MLGASNKCLEAYNANVSCPTEVGWLYGNPYQNLDESTLSRHSLYIHRDQVASSCSDGVEYLDSRDNSTYVATALDDAILTAYETACLKRT